MDIAANIKRIRKIKDLSQKQVAMEIGIAQAQYSVIESGKTVPTIPTLQKIAKVFQVNINEFFKIKGEIENEINLSILEKVKLIDSLEDDEKEALIKMIDIAISKKKLKDNLTNLISA